MGRSLLECEDLVKSFDGLDVVTGVSLALEAGRVKAIVGPNGSGKTTLFHLLAGSIVPDRGSVRRSVAPPPSAPERGIGRLFQDVRVFPRLSTLENVLVAFPEQDGEDPLSAVLHPARIRQDDQRLSAEARVILTSLGLERDWALPAGSLSWGQQKLLGIARLIACDAPVWLLDEPSAGVSPTTCHRLLGLIRSAANEGRAVAIIEHDMAFVRSIADWAYVMVEGAMVAEGPAESVLGSTEFAELYLGL